MTIARLRSGAWFARRPVRVLCATLALVYVIAIATFAGTSDGLVDYQGRPLGTDFVSFWSAARLALDGAPEAAYDPARHAAAQRHAIGRDELPYYAWLYPPVFLLVVLPLALLPYAWALAVWLAATLGAYLAVAARLVPDRLAIWLALAFPAAFVNLIHGQNGFLTAALLGGALHLMRARPAASGVLIGVLAVKPQLGLLLPFALAAGRQWRAFAAAALTVLALAGASLLVFGRATWQAFAASSGLGWDVALVEGAAGFTKLQSTFAAVRLVGGPVWLGAVAQAAVTVTAAAVVVWLWRGRAAFELKAAALPIAALLATPFVLDYDLVLLAPAIAFFAADGARRGFLPWEISALAGLWLLAPFARPLATAFDVPITALCLMGALALVVRRARRLTPGLNPGVAADGA